MKKFKIKGNSMNPLFQDGQFVAGNTAFNPDHLKKYDIVVYEYNGEHFCHYVWKKFKNFKSGEDNIIQTRPLNPVWDYDDYITTKKLIAIVINQKISFLRRIYIEIVSLFVGKGKV